MQTTNRMIIEYASLIENGDVAMSLGEFARLWEGLMEEAFHEALEQYLDEHNTTS